MIIITNEKLIRRNSRIGLITALGGSAILIAGVIPVILRWDQYLNLTLIAIAVGYILSQIGFYFSNRWGRRPRPDEHINTALKGLDRNYTLYHYSSPTFHLLVGPAGVWAFFHYHQRGAITFEKGRWRQRGGGIMLAYQKIFAQEGIGRPDREIADEITAIQRSLGKHLSEDEIPPIHAALIFTHPKVDLQAEDAPAPTINPKALKGIIRKAAKDKDFRLGPEKAAKIKKVLEGED